MPDEARLIRQAQRGDAQACAVLYDRHYDAVYRYCYYRLGDGHAAQDVAGEVFVRMVEKLDTFRPRGRPLLAWLYTIARNLVTDRYRQQGQANEVALEAAVPLADDGDGPDRLADRRLEAECLSLALAHLTEDQRQVILLKFMENLSNAQVACVLDKSEGAIKSLQHRALAALRRAIEKEGCHETRD